MGVFFKWQDEVVWNPSPRMTRLFLAQVRALEEALEVQSGIGEMIADEVELNPSLLETFVSVLVEELESETSSTFKTLIAGPFAMAYGILRACEPKSPRPTMRGATEHLARRGEVLVSGRGRVGPIYEGLVD
ncbi:DUF6086 family protein [Pyxidicoccus xibeiensis]|uniref:DUF6086 family protein n=1 Tax=Pyxidicoccus xibeiensis TaxID=2906759 RepID=UPI0020A826CA|nr:DUF6086 family protein [Pyxidicoccus xibeiensis]MCP3139428.1 DUF6086 family protein [Pyxidicoccus xibeiensis]